VPSVKWMIMPRFSMASPCYGCIGSISPERKATRCPM